MKWRMIQRASASKSLRNFSLSGQCVIQRCIDSGFGSYFSAGLHHCQRASTPPCSSHDERPKRLCRAAIAAIDNEWRRREGREPTTGKITVYAYCADHTDAHVSAPKTGERGARSPCSSKLFVHADKQAASMNECSTDYQLVSRSAVALMRWIDRSAPTNSCSGSSRMPTNFLSKPYTIQPPRLAIAMPIVVPTS